MRGSVVVLALLVTPFVATIASAQDTQPANPGDQKCAVRDRGNSPDAPRPDPDTPAPVRFLPAFDNALRGYDDRTRIVDDAHRLLSVAGTRVVLVDGRVSATWTVTDDAVTVTPLRTFTRTERSEVAEEADRLTDFLT